jgi:dephospho-CoA kinase
MAFQYAVGLTGGIATGKSSTTMLLSLHGFRYIEADKIAHDILDTHSGAIALLFGAQFVKGGKVDRAALGKMIFAEPDKKLALENFMHPLIYKEIERQSEELDNFKYPYLVDIPLLYETNRYPIEKSIVVYAPKEIQLERLMKRDGYDEYEARQRIESQMDIEDKKIRATYVIDNSADLKHLQRECARVKDEILEAFREA